MTPKQKAKELCLNFQKKLFINLSDKEEDADYIHNDSKDCALEAVAEIILSEPRYPSDVDWDDCGGTYEYFYEAQREEAKKYWLEVRNEILNL